MVEAFLKEVQASIYERFSERDTEFIMRCIGDVATKYSIEKSCTDMVKWEPSLPECYKAFMVTRKIDGVSPGTLDLYKRYIEDFLLNCGKTLDRVSANDIRMYLYHVKEQRGISNRTLDSRRTALSSFFTWSAANGYIDKNPCAVVNPIKYAVKEREPLSDTELELIRSSCRTIRERAIVEVLYSTACRVSELSILKKSDINVMTKEVTLFGKGSKYRTSFLSDTAVLYLTRYWYDRKDDNEYAIVSERSPHAAMSRGAIERIISVIGDRAGVPNLHPHLFRHSAATNLLKRGMDVTQLRDLLGHASLDTTMIYAKTDRRSISENHRKYIN